MVKHSPQEIENRKFFSHKLNILLATKNKKQIDLHRDLNIPKSTITGYVKGTSLPNPGNLQKIADYFNVKKSELDLRFKDDNIRIKNPFKLDNPNTTVNEINETVGKLVEKRQTKVLKYAKKELAEQNQIKEEQRLYSVQAVSGAAAGIGYSYDNDEIETYYTDEEPPRHDYATVVCGDSMEPNLSNGDIALIRAGYDNINGDIYVIDYNDKSYIKKLYHDGDRLRLVSINDKYEPIYIELPADSYLNIVGKVVGSFKPKE